MQLSGNIDIPMLGLFYYPMKDHGIGSTIKFVKKNNSVGE